MSQRQLSLVDAVQQALSLAVFEGDSYLLEELTDFDEFFLAHCQSDHVLNRILISACEKSLIEVLQMMATKGFVLPLPASLLCQAYHLGGSVSQKIRFLLLAGAPGELIDYEQMNHASIEDFVEARMNNAIEAYRTGAVPLTCASHRSWPPLLIAVKCDLTKIVGLLVQLGANVAFKGYGGYEPIHDAAEFASISTCRTLIGAGGDVNAIAHNGDTPLLRSIAQCRFQMASFLIEAGARYDNVRFEGHALVHFAALSGCVETFTLLMNRCGQSILGLKAANGWQPLHIAAYGGHEKLCEFLLLAGADPNSQDLDGRSALFAVLQSPRVIRNKTFTDRARPATCPIQKIPPPSSVSEAKKLDMCKLLVKYGADTSLVDKDGISIMDIASQFQIESVVHLLSEQVT